MTKNRSSWNGARHKWVCLAWLPTYQGQCADQGRISSFVNEHLGNAICKSGITIPHGKNFTLPIFEFKELLSNLVHHGCNLLAN